MSGSRIRMDFIRTLAMATNLKYLIPALAALIAGCSGTSDEPEPPVSDGYEIVWTPESPLKGETVTFSVPEAENDVRSILWTFGDNGTKSADGASSVTHVYEYAGTYNVQAYLTLKAGGMKEVTAKVSVSDTDAAMILSNIFPARMETVTFGVTSVPGIQSISWDFGDGQTEKNSMSPVHQYTKDGKYEVNAEVSLSGGKAIRLSQSVSVEGKSLSWACRNFT